MPSSPSPPSSSPGSLSSASSTSNSDRTAPLPSSPPPITFLSLNSPNKAPAFTSTKPILPPYPSSASANPQPFFPVATTPRASESPTSYQFPVVEQTIEPRPARPSVSRTPSPPTISQRQARPTRVRRQSTQVYGGATSPNGGNAGGAGDPANQLEAKVVILGSQGVGKTSIVHRYTSGHFSYSLSSTIGASFLTKKLVVDSCKVRLQIWDTAGQERFRSMAPLYYRGALAAILVYDITNEDSFNDVKIWLEELRRNMSPDLIIHVVGSKGDLASSHRQVNLEDARRSIASWVHEANLLDSRLYNPSTSRERDTSPPSPSRSRALGSRRGSILATAGSSSSSVPTITTSAPPPDTLGARVRKMSTKLGTLPTVASTSGVGGTSTASSSVSELGQLSSSGPEGMIRSTSKLSLSLGLGMSSSRGRKSAEEERRSTEDIERARLDELVKECGVEVSEVSAKDDFGIEDLFLLITSRLVERKSQIDSDRVLRSRDSIMLRDNDDEATTHTGGWCC